MPSISVVIPCFNGEATLRRAVASALAQAHLHEVIIVDDHSTDGSYDVAAVLADADRRVCLLQTERNSGPGAARNQGAAHATGDHLSFLDADDELLGEFFAAALALLTANPAMSGVKADTEFFDPQRGYILPMFDVRYPAVVLSSAWGMVLRKDAFDRIGGFPDDPVFRGRAGGEDVAFMSAVMKFCQPLGRIARFGYRCWSRQGSHLDYFLGHTRINGDSFEFIRLRPEQLPGGTLAVALDAYMARVTARWEGRPPTASPSCG